MVLSYCIVTIWIHALLGSCQVQEHVDVWMWGLGHCSQLQISLSVHLVILQVLVQCWESGQRTANITGKQLL